MRSILHQGRCYAKYRRPREVSRRANIQSASPTSRDKYDAILDILGDMGDREGRKAGGLVNLEQFTVCAIRGFGVHKVALCVGAYGSELESIMRRQGRSEKGFLRHPKLGIPTPNRIAEAASGGRFGNITGDGTDEISSTINDFFALE